VFICDRYVPTIAVSVSKPKKKKVHESYCFCCDDGGDLIECAVCPKVYHLECVGLKKVPKGMWQCNWHSCYTCLRSSANSGGVQFRCVDCPLAYCFDCFPKHIELKTLDPLPSYFTDKYRKSGFDITPNSLYFRCNECTADMVEKREKEEQERQRKMKWATLKSQIQRKLQSATSDIYRRMAHNRSIQVTLTMYYRIIDAYIHCMSF
jgi:SWI/SNF-related matrix-associated actin-dependent regulator of chromatin subfamily A member 5